jgi:octaprenyl-diphosphate synthase
MKQIVAFIREHGGIEYSKNKMVELQNQAFEILDELPIPDQTYKLQLKQLVKFVIDRDI